MKFQRRSKIAKWRLRRRFAKLDVYFLLLVALCVPGAILINYLYDRYESGMSFDSESWGLLGDFLGGTLNPFIALLTLLILVRTVLQNQEVIDLSRKELVASRKVLEATVEELTLTRSLQAKTEEALVKQNQIALKTQELMILGEGHRYLSELFDNAQKNMYMAEQEFIKIRDVLISIGVDPDSPLNAENVNPIEKIHRENYLVARNLVDEAYRNFQLASEQQREVGGMLGRQAKALAKAYIELEASSPADASSPTP